ncbi:MAG: MlaD family protein [Planctomycetota bacterium]
MSRGARTRLGAVTVGAALLIVLGLGVWGVLRRVRRASVRVHIYLAESVQGLQLHSPVRLRGLKIGEVDEIGIASDGRLVELECSLWWDRLVELRLVDPTQPFGPQHGPFAPPGLYAHLAQVGFTDLRVVQLDFYPADRVLEYPLPEDAPWAHVPGVQSTPQAIKEFVERRFKGAGAALESGVELLEAVEAQSHGLDGLALRTRIENQLDDLEAAIQSAPPPAELEGLVDEGRRGLAELSATVAEIGSAIHGEQARQLAAQIDDVLAALGEQDLEALGADLRSELVRQREAAESLRPQVPELRAELVALRRWLEEFRAQVRATAEDRDGLLVSPGSAEKP